MSGPLLLRHASQSRRGLIPPNVAVHHRRDLELSPPPDDAFPPDSGPPAVLLDPDLPPPYSECARPREPAEEPPPPYSACYVTYSNPKDGIPSVHFFNGRRQRLFGSAAAAGQATVVDTGQQGAGISTVDRPGFEDNAAHPRDARFVFENGRIVERDTDDERIQIPVDCASRDEAVASGNVVANDRVLQVDATDRVPPRSVLVA